MTILSNMDVGGVRDQVRMNALESFSFFANSVLGATLPEPLCEQVQDVFDEREDAFLSTRCPRALAVALLAWFSSHGVQVVTSARIPQHEVLHWLDLLGEREVGEVGAVLTVQPDGVQVRWV